MATCAHGEVPISKGDKLNKDRCPKTSVDKREMEFVPYARLVGSFMYAQVCTRLDLSFTDGMLSRFQSDHGHKHWIVDKKSVKKLELIGFTDSYFASNYPASMKSTCGYVYMLAGGAVAWKTMKQSLIATSTMQAEIIAIYEAAVFFSKNSKRSNNSKHIDLKFYSVRKRVKDEEIDIAAVSTDAQLADPFTKALSVSAFKKHVEDMGILSSLDS
ncbi:secreted RxLR effector protein 161-like [Rosa rugosa]|uniref:secreted RxLR effector protein 161-like n=1 Tax=Rosa rugosa TaxID=74645 RepID=UPI002B413FA8|nr:secreted RxLR effector protein 161-like [Rosa rugosa]